MTVKQHRWIMHVDMDAFFAAVEQRDDPVLRGKPVVVGAQPGGRGVVATCSYEARRFGIRSAMPIKEAYRRCPTATYLRPDMSRYAEESRNIMNVLESISPVVEPVSIDEAFVDVTGLEKLLGKPEQIARITKQRIFEAVQLTASVGIGVNRLIAKLASDYRKPDGCTIVKPEQVLDFLGPMPVRNLRGIGIRTAERLEKLSLYRIADLWRCPRELLIHNFGAKGADLLYYQSRGTSSDIVGDTGPRKSISRETTFSEDIEDWAVLNDVLLDLAADVGHQTRREGLTGRVVTLKIRFESFETCTRRQILDQPTNHDNVIFSTAKALSKDRDFRSKAVRLIGVGLSDWETMGTPQLDLFDSKLREDKDNKLYATLDEIQNRFGKQCLRRGVKKRRQSH
jgi:DNA polymerase-4